MKVQIFQHVPFETPGILTELFNDLGFETCITRFFEDGHQIDNEYEILIIMGGPMNIYQEKQYPWLKEEKSEIKNAIQSDKIVIGFCLGAQLIADSLGSKVFKNEFPEIGWHPVAKNSSCQSMNFLPEFATVFHWHSETFNLPKGAELIYSSDVTFNQAFIFNRKIIGLQFHLELTEQGIRDLSNYCSDELINSPYVSTPAEMLQDYTLYEASNRKILTHLIKYIISP